MARISLTVLLFVTLSFSALAQNKKMATINDMGFGLDSQIKIHNPSELSQDFVLAPFDDAGNALTQVTGSLRAGERLNVSATELLGEQVAHVNIVEGTSLQVSVLLGNARFEPSAQRASSWHVEVGDLEKQVDSLAITNSSPEAADIWISLIDSNGQLSATRRLVKDLAPGAQMNTRLGGPQSAAVEGDVFRIHSSQALAVTAVRGTYNRDGSVVVAANKALAFNKASTTRDDRGVWFIESDTLYDSMVMQGYNVAIDRLWQAEIYKRTATGRLSEFFGAPLIGQDSAVRSTGYSGEELDAYFADLHQDSKDMIQGYADGFNQRIAEVNADPVGLLPFEFKALGVFALENWSHRDVMSWLSVLQRNFSALGNLGFSQVGNALDLLSMANKYGQITGSAMFIDANWVNDPDAPVMIPDLDGSKRAAVMKKSNKLNFGKMKKMPLDELDAFRAMVSNYEESYDENVRLLKEVGGFVKGGSYAWAVAGSKTESGLPTVYSGPQMGFSAPAIVIEGSHNIDGLQVSGMTVAGIPGIIIGRTPHHAWSMQVGHTNTWDFYVDDEADVVLHHVETIHVAGGDDVTVPIFRSPHGPVVAQSPFILSWKYASWGREWNLAEGNLALIRAESMEEFGAGVANLGVTQHYTYADRDGNIAYWMSGMRPVRQPGEYRLPQGLFGPSLEWDADVLETPVHDANTPQGFYAGWNNKASVDYDDTSANYLYGRYHRAEVIQEYLRTHDNLSFEDIKNIAVNISTTLDFANGSGGNLWPHVADGFAAVVAANSTPAREAALEMLQAWDGHRVAGGEEQWINGTDVADAWYLLEKWVSKAIDKTFLDEFGFAAPRITRFDMFIRELNPSTTLHNNYRRYARNYEDASAPQTLTDIIITSLDESLAELGDQPWGTDARGEINYRHELGLPIPGTPWASRSTYAHVIEYGPDGPTRIQSMFPLGESGFINADENGAPVFDPHFFSMKSLFDNFIMRDFPLFE